MHSLSLRSYTLRRRRADRRGATLVLIAVMSTALLSVGALVINWSYIELTNTQLRSATDAAAKAACIALSQTQNKGDARSAAKEVASAYTVAGQQLKLVNDDIVFGTSELQEDGSYLFIEGEAPENSAQVTAQMGGSSSNSSVSTFFSHLVSPVSFDLAKEATAGRYDHDIVIVVDRSGSMAWDLSGEEFSYPAEYNNDSTLQNYFRAPHPTESRWAKLVEALAAFKQVIDSRDLNAQVGLASYASDYTFGLYQSNEVSTDQLMSLNTDDFLAAAIALGEEPIIGDTDIKAGLIEGKDVLLSSGEKRGTAHRTMILLSDGVYTEGGSPVSKATNFHNNKRITIHTISFSDGADQNLMADVAAGAGGTHYHAPDADTLVTAFEDIAEQLPAVLTH